MENQSSYDRITKKFADFFVDFKKVMSSTAYNDPTMCFVVDFYDPSAIFYNKHINIFGDDLPNVSAIDPDKIFKVDEQFKEFIKKRVQIKIKIKINLNLIKTFNLQALIQALDLDIVNILIANITTIIKRVIKLKTAISIYIIWKIKI